MQIGRITALTEPHDWQATGDNTVAMTADYQSSQVSDGMFVRDQLLAYPTLDEDVIPIILASEPRSSGFYRPLRSEVLTEQLSRIRGHIFNYRLDLERVAGFTQPLIESVINGARLTNVIGAVDADTEWFWAVAQLLVGGVQDVSNSQNPASSGTRVSADGTLWFLFDSGVAGISSIGRSFLDPPTYYVGAARIEQGSPLRSIVGRNMIQADVVNWRLSNGLIRITPNGGNLQISGFNGTTWSTPKDFNIGSSANGATAIASLAVLRNSPEECVIRLVLGGVLTFGGLIQTATVDVALRRGDQLARIYASCNVVETFRMKLATPEAATAIAYGAITGGAIRATANDASGNRFVMLSYQQATTSDLVNGRLTLNAAGKTADFAIGLEMPGGTATAGQTAVDLAKQYLAAQNESQRVVAR